MSQQEHLDREIEKRVIRTNPLGRDKDHNRYWFFPREGRIFVEDEKSTTWGYYAAKEEVYSVFGRILFFLSTLNHGSLCKY